MKTRKPTGMPAWPILLIAGVEKAGKTYAAAEACTSDLIGRTIWFGVGEDDPDEYGALGDFDIAVHDGTYRGLLNALKEASAEPVGEKPNLWVLDSGTRLWALLSDMAQVEANRRWKARDQNKSKPIPEDGISINMDLWNVAKSRWQNVIDLLREHQGPSIITARMEHTTVVNAKGDPTKDKVWKVQAEKGLPFDVGVVVEMLGRGDAYITGVRSLRFITKQPRTPYPKFTVDDLWRKLGLADGAGHRTHTSATGEESVAADDRLTEDRKRLLDEIREAVGGNDEETAQIARQWMSDYDHSIRTTTDLGRLELLRDDLRSKAKVAS